MVRYITLSSNPSRRERAKVAFLNGDWGPDRTKVADLARLAKMCGAQELTFPSLGDCNHRIEPQPNLE
jgi:hypothetical protein